MHAEWFCIPIWSSPMLANTANPFTSSFGILPKYFLGGGAVA